VLTWIGGADVEDAGGLVEVVGGRVNVAGGAVTVESTLKLDVT
jgi:hypothetical protein